MKGIDFDSYNTVNNKNSNVNINSITVFSLDHGQYKKQLSSSAIEVNRVLHMLNLSCDFIAQIGRA